MEVGPDHIQQRLAVFSSAEYFLESLLDGIDLRTITYDTDSRALVIEYQGGTDEGTDGFHERLLTVGLVCARSLQGEGWPAEFDRVVGIACEPTEKTFQHAAAVRWSASLEWLRQFTAEDVPKWVFVLESLERIEVVHPDGRIEPADRTDLLNEVIGTRT